MFRKEIYLLLIFILSNSIYGSDIGCLSTIKIEDKECSENSILKDNTFILDALVDKDKTQEKKSPIVEVGQKVKITEKLDSLSITFQKKKIKIERVSNMSCPPYCISPMNISKVKTVGELETIDFIKSFKKSKSRILVDARSSSEYKKGSIPTSVNIPYSMLKPKSKYKNQILKLLGVKRIKKRWSFRHVHKLLIFDNGILDSRASKIIKTLIEIGYPKNRLLYYRGGVESWKRLGLTLL